METTMLFRAHRDYRENGISHGRKIVNGVRLPGPNGPNRSQTGPFLFSHVGSFFSNV